MDPRLKSDNGPDLVLWFDETHFNDMESEIDDLKRGDIVEFVGVLYKLKVQAGVDLEHLPLVSRNQIHFEDNYPHFLARSIEMIGHETAPSEIKHKYGRYNFWTINSQTVIAVLFPTFSFTSKSPVYPRPIYFTHSSFVFFIS